MKADYKPSITAYKRHEKQDSRAISDLRNNKHESSSKERRTKAKLIYRCKKHIRTDIG